MNQHDQMLREALRDYDQFNSSNPAQRLNKAERTIERFRQALAAEPTPLVRLTEHQLEQLGCGYAEDFDFANAIMEAMIKNNGGKHE